MTQGEILREARARIRMTQAALACAAGVGRATVQRVEADRPVSFETIRAL